MKLSPFQIQALRGAIRSHEAGFSIRRAVFSGWKQYSLLVLIFGGGAAFYWWGGWPFAAALFLGLLIGQLIRDIQWLRIAKRMWPVNDHITNWDSVRKLVSENESGAT